MIEERVGHYIREVCKEIIDENVLEEARLSMPELDYNIWKSWRDNNNVMIGNLPCNRWPQLDASYDVAWQQKESGNVQFTVQIWHSLWLTYAEGYWSCNQEQTVQFL